jgi:hypothetical protein
MWCREIVSGLLITLLERDMGVCIGLNLYSSSNLVPNLIVEVVLLLISVKSTHTNS